MFKDQGRDSVEKRFERAKEKVDELIRLLNMGDEYRFAYNSTYLDLEQPLELLNMLTITVSSTREEI